MSYSMPKEVAEVLAEQASVLPHITAQVKESKQKRGYHIFLRHRRERLQTSVYTRKQFESLLTAWAQFEV